jgi:hypothetical protein
MSTRLAESAVLIASTVCSNESNSHPQFAAIAPAPFDSQRCIVEPQQLAEIVFYITQTVAQSGVQIAPMLLSNDCNSHPHRSANLQV